MPASELEDHVRLRIEEPEPDPLVSTVVVRDVATGEVLLSHRYGLGDQERRWALAMEALTLASAPTHNVASFLAGEPQHLGGTNLLAGGKRPWLLAASLLVGALLAWRAWVRAGGEGSSRALRLFWTLAVLLLGFPAWVVLAILARRPRARLAPAPEPAEALQPRIRTA